MKVFTAIPCGELSRYSQFWASVEGVRMPQGSMKPTQCRGLYIPTAQNVLARLFLETDCEVFWLLNDDQIYSPGILLELLERMKLPGVDIVAPLCLSHNAPYPPLIYDDREGDDYIPRLLKTGDQGMVPIIATGGGGMLVHRRVIEGIPDPWWEQHTCGKSQSSEDMDFCAKVIAAGFKIWCDLDIIAGHLTIFNVSASRTEAGEWMTLLIREPEALGRPAAVLPPKKASA